MRIEHIEVKYRSVTVNGKLNWIEKNISFPCRG